MKKWFSKFDFTLVFRIALSIAMSINGYLQNDDTSYMFAVFLALYALIAAKYKVGCGYSACVYTPNYAPKSASKA